MYLLNIFSLQESYSMLNLFIKKRYNDLKFELIPFLREHNHEHHVRKGYNKLKFVNFNTCRGEKLLLR